MIMHLVKWEHLVIIAFTNVMRLLNLLKPKPPAPNIDVYGQPIGMEPEQIQSLMEWFFASLMAAEYFGKSHLFWYNSAKPDQRLEKALKKVIYRDEPIFLYRCSDRTMPLPQGHYWRMIQEHPSMRIYQLEFKDEDLFLGETRN